MKDDSQKIKIKTVRGGNDKGMLKDCYFLPTEVFGEYNFFSKDEPPTGKPLASGISQSRTFHFKLGLFDWTCDGFNFLISDTAAHGDWKNNDKSPHRDDGDGESGTFTAQAGGSGTIESEEAETGYSATA